MPSPTPPEIAAELTRAQWRDLALCAQYDRVSWPDDQLGKGDSKAWWANHRLGLVNAFCRDHKRLTPLGEAVLALRDQYDRRTR